MLQLISDEDFNFQILRALAQAPYRGSDVGEVLIAANQVKPGDWDSFYNAFYALATRADNIAEAIDPKKYPVSSADAYFKAASYYRAADFYLHGNWSDPRVNELWDKALSTWDRANSLTDHPGERVTLNGPNFTIPAIFFSCGKPGKRPTVIIGTGYDGSQEELYHQLGLSALQRGINVITYEGPGQPTVRREQNIGFIPEWEKVVTPVVDYALTRRDVDPKAIGLIGSSFGGYLAPRAAAFEHRLAAVMALDGIHDFGGIVLGNLNPPLLDMFNAGNKTGVDEFLLAFSQDPTMPTGSRWSIQQGLWSFYTESPFDYLTMTQEYTLKGVVDKIKTPVFVGDAQNDMFVQGQAKELAEQLGSFAHYHLFETIDGAGEHCSLGAAVLANQVVLDWFQDLVSGNSTGCD